MKVVPTDKKRYVKPTVKAVKLTTALPSLGTDCHTIGAANPSDGICNLPPGNNCSDL